MKKFRFKLEGILKMRRETERQCEMEVQRIQALIQNILLRQTQIIAEQTQWRQSFNDPAATFSWRSLIENYLIALDHESAYQERVQAGLEVEMKEAQEKLKEAYKARKQVEHLKDKQRQEYLQKINKLMEKEMAEMTILRFVRNQSSQNNYGEESL